ncbi:MAG: MmcQ/YjbR family DNA-binding protein [Oscillospiraceae bacterium]
MTRAELIAYCLSYSDIVEDYPFGDNKSTIMRHGKSRKWFALIIELDGRLAINLKCEPMQADFYRHVYCDVIPAWHMSKTHWNTVFINGDVPQNELFAMINQSYLLTIK